MGKTTKSTKQKEPEPEEKKVERKPRPDPKVTPTAVQKHDSGIRCISCGKFVDGDLTDHADGHKAEMLAKAKKEKRDPYPLQVLFLEYENGRVKGKKVF